MCGITGIFNLNGAPVSPVILRKMTDTIAHRGPDGEGFYTDSFIGLGHRRLAIIDLSPAGHQPMITRDGQYIIAYNGEIYNYKEIKNELIKELSENGFELVALYPVLKHFWLQAFFSRPWKICGLQKQAIRSVAFFEKFNVICFNGSM